DARGHTWLRNYYGELDGLAETLEFDRVVRQVRGDGLAASDIVYEPVARSAGGLATLKAIVNDRAGHVHAYWYDRQGRLLTAHDYTGRAAADAPTTSEDNRPADPLRPADPEFFETRYAYNADGMCTRIVHPSGA